MISIQDYINNIKNGTNIVQDPYKKSSLAENKPLTTSGASVSFKPDSFQKADNKPAAYKDNKTDKKKIFKIGAIVTGIALAFLAFLKRKRIASALSALFRKNQPSEPPSAPLNNIPNPKTPPSAPSNLPSKPIKNSDSLINGEPVIKPDTKINAADDAKEAIQKGVKAVSNEIESTPTLSKYTELNTKWQSMADNNPEKDELGRKIVAIRKQMIEQNISFVPKAPESFGSDEAKWDYLYGLMDIPVNNEATAIDILNIFEKHGGRVYDKNTGIYSLTDICRSALLYANDNTDNIESANRIYQKYADSVFKYATNEVPKGGYSPDAAELLPAYNKSRDKMTKDTVLKFIDAFKNIAADKKQYKDINYFLSDGSWQTFYPQLKQADIPDIRKALEEFAAAVENLPDDIMSIN